MPAWQIHRARHLAGLCEGRSVHLAGVVDNATRQVLAEIADLVDSSADLVLSLPALTARAALATLPDLLSRCEADGMLVICEAVGDSGAGDVGLRAALAARFGHVATLQQRKLAGSVIASAAQARSRILPLSHPPDDAAFCLIHLCGPVAVTLPGVALHQDAGTAGWTPAPTLPVAGPGLALPPAAIRPAQADLRARAVALAERLARQTDVLARQDVELAQLRAGLPVDGMAHRRRTRAAGAKQAWPLADNPSLRPDNLDLYERRVDDAVIVQSRHGTEFLERFGLLGVAPDFDGAIAALNARTLVRPTAPDVTIVMPVHGQFAYTLNCLDSLWDLPDAASFEIIVIDDASADATRTRLADIAAVQRLRNDRNQGFIASCNRGAGEAAGRFVLFLNNDTRVVAGALDALVDSFDRFPRAGLVGSKLFYPDGRLQEAGGIIWRDASAWNDGRDGDPNHPATSFARQVDYVSGCAIMLPTDLWRQLGGFDPLFSPAYCEDADLALRVRAAGREVWFQPQSRVIHYEGRTSGTDVTQGVKAYQATNARKLFLRWRDALAHHRTNGDAPWLERERDVHRRALVIDATAPTPGEDAGSVTTMLTLRLFQRLGYKAHYVPQDNFLYQPRHVDALLAEGVEVAYAPYDVDFARYIREHGARFDVVLVFRVTILERVIDDLLLHATAAPILFHNMDLHFLRMQRQAEADGDAYALARAEDMRARELDLIARVDCTITHSTYERDLLAELVPDAPVVVWPFMFEFHGTGVGFAERRDLCFLGGYGHGPNVDAVIFMAEQVMPLIWREEPEARFIIAGAKPAPEVLRLANRRVIVTGQVPDLRTVFDACRVFACALRIGAGTKGKVSTAMAYGIPVVTTSCGAEGMDLLDGEEVLIADHPEDFAAACLRVYREPPLWTRLSEAGQRLVQQKHSLEMGERVLDEAIETGLRRKLELDF